MYPILFEIGPLKIYSYGFMLVIAFYTCFYLLNHDMKRLGYDNKFAPDIVFWAAVGGILGSKLYYLLENLDQVIQDPFGMIFSGSGLVFLGGLMGGTFCVTMVLRKNNLPWLVFADIVAPLLILGYGIGRIGCFLVGDDYGILSDLPWAMTFPNGLPPTFSAVHPTQMYETILALGIFSFLWSRRKNVQVTGNLFFTYLILAGVERFMIEFIRINEKYFFGEFSGAQIISVIMICIGTYFLLFPVPKSDSVTS